MPLTAWLLSRRGKGRRLIFVMLALALTANVWSMNPAAGHGLSSTDSLDLAADTAAIVTISEAADTAKGLLDDPDQGPFTAAYSGIPDGNGGMAAGAHRQIATSSAWDGFPHKTGPPARS